jgi:hypothetical protein
VEAKIALYAVNAKSFPAPVFKIVFLPKLLTKALGLIGV